MKGSGFWWFQKSNNQCNIRKLGVNEIGQKYYLSNLLYKISTNLYSEAELPIKYLINGMCKIYKKWPIQIWQELNAKIQMLSLPLPLPLSLSLLPAYLEDIIVLHGTFPRYSSRTVNYSLTLRYSSHHQSFKKKTFSISAVLPPPLHHLHFPAKILTRVSSLFSLFLSIPTLLIQDQEGRRQRDSGQAQQDSCYAITVLFHPQMVRAWPKRMRAL